MAVWTGEDSHEATQVEARAEGADRARGTERPADRRAVRRARDQPGAYSSGATSSWPMPRSFEPAGAPQRQGRLERENARLKGLVGERVLELKKSEEILGEARPVRQGGGAQRARCSSASGSSRPSTRSWGYRRILAHLRYVDGLAVNPEARLRRDESGRPAWCEPNLKLRASRKPDTRKPRPTRPNQWWGIDMTKVIIEGFGWVYLVVVLDRHSKKVVGHYAGLQARAWHWLVALNRACEPPVPAWRSRAQRLNLMAATAASRPPSPSCAPAPHWASARRSPATATPKQRRHRAIPQDAQGGAGLAA